MGIKLLVFRIQAGQEDFFFVNGCRKNAKKDLISPSKQPLSASFRQWDAKRKQTVTIEEEQYVKKYLTKPIVAVAASGFLLAGAAPLLADANASLETPGNVKVVMKDQGEQVMRYRLQDLAKDDPDLLNTLLKNQADHLYLTIDELGLDTHLQTYMAENKEEFERVYNNYYEKIWLEVRFNNAEDAKAIISAKAEAKGAKVYVKGIVSSGVTEVKVVKPDGDTITVKPTSGHSFAVSFAVSGRSGQQVITVKAYENAKLVDTRELKVLAEDGPNPGEEKAEAVAEPDAAEMKVPVFAAGDLTGTAVFDAKTKKIKVKGKLAGFFPNAKVSLAVLDSAGVKQTVKPNAHGDFTINIPLNGKKTFFAGDAVKLALYRNGELVLEKEIPVSATQVAKKKKTPNGQAHGYWKNKGKWIDDDRDEGVEDDHGNNDKGKGKNKD